MIRKFIIVVVFLSVALFALLTSLSSQPYFNGDTPGCGNVSACHLHQDGILSVAVMNSTDVEITLSGTTGNVAGELVDSTGTVVAVNNLSGSNSFTLTAPHEGRFTVNAGYKDPSRRWDSATVLITLTDVDGSDRGGPMSYGLGQNYPNPFNPGTVIEYTIAERTHVTLKVYDLTGREVATLVDGFEGPGTRSVRFNAENISTGMYLYRLQAGDYSETKHLMVMR